jgi:Tol biopolymer transport system component
MSTLTSSGAGRLFLGGSAAVLLAFLVLAAPVSPPQFTPWGKAVPVGPPINETTNLSDDGCPFISKNGLDLYFRKWVSSSYDIFVSHRDSVDDPWETPISLNLNTTSGEICSFVTNDGYWLYFVSNRPGSLGGTDIWVSHRKNKHDDQGWETPKNLGPEVNGSTGEVGPAIFEDESGNVVLSFTKNVDGKNKIYSSQMLDRETPGPASPVEELNAPGFNNLHAFIRRSDGLEVIFASDRESPTAGLVDLFVATRLTTRDPWSTPKSLGPNINTSRNEIRPSISWDGTTLYFWTDRTNTPGWGWQMHVYQATRSEIIGPPEYSAWSAPVNLGKIVNSSDADAGAFISEDGLSLYFGSTRPGGYGGFDIWVSQRASKDDPWGAPQNLGPTINTSDNEQTPALSLDGHWLYFASDKSSGYGGLDLYVSRRPNKRDDFGWQALENLGSLVNTPATESGPALFEDSKSGATFLYFNSDQLVAGTEHIYASVLQPDEVLTLPCMLRNPVSCRPWVTWGAAAAVEELNSLNRDVRPAIRKDGLEMFLDSDRPGAVGGQDIWVSTRASTSDPWPLPKNLGSTVNSKVLEARPALSSDGTELYFHSNRPGGSGANDLYRCTRTRLKGEF